MREIIRAEHSGFCYGVRAAVEAAEKALECAEEKRIYCLGELIHNRLVTGNLEEKGLLVIDRPEEAEEDSTIIIRSHGEGPDIYRRCRDRRLNMIDATCPHVKKLHELVADAHQAGKLVVIVGDRNHPEVMGVNGWCDNQAVILAGPENLQDLRLALKGMPCNRSASGPSLGNTAPEQEFDHSACLTESQTHDHCMESDSDQPDKSFLKAYSILGFEAEAGAAAEDEEYSASEPDAGHGFVLYIVAQTTIRQQHFDETCSAVQSLISDCFPAWRVEIKNTICNATEQRQQSCLELAAHVDGMIIIGGRNSSNTHKLYDVAKSACDNVFFVENMSDLPLKQVKEWSKIGLAAGASTPECLIKEVITNMTENENLTMADFMDDIEASLRLPRNGEMVTGTVISVHDNDVIVNLGCKKDGIIPAGEVSMEEGQTLADLFKEGDEVEAKVIKTDDGEGVITLSRKRLEINEHWKELAAALEEKTLVNVKVIRTVKGGVIAAYKEVTGFIPLAHLSDKYIENPEEFIGDEFDVYVTRIEQARNRVSFSRRDVLNEEKKKALAEIWSQLSEGDLIEGKVMRFTNYGAFVDIGGIDGLLHISEISWGKLRHPSEALAIGDIIQVKILSMNEEKGKISLGLKQTIPEPWSVIDEKYAAGQVVQGKVVQIKEYGAFVELEPGLDGLVHISEIAHKRVEDIAEELTVGQTVDTKILEIDNENKRISLSIKACIEPEAEAPAEEPAVEEPAEEAASEEAATEDAE